MADPTTAAPPRVFISYTHDSQEHMDRIWNLSERLRGDGVDCRIDQHEESPPEGWPRWCDNQVEQSQFVLIACTDTYQRRYEGKEEAGKGLGGTWEGFIITQELYEAQGKNVKFIPLVFVPDDNQHVPIVLRATTRYDLAAADGYDKLFRRITTQPARKPSPVAGAVRTMPTAAATQNAPAEQQAPLQTMPAMERKSSSPKPPDQLFTVPLPPNPFFTGREEVLDELKKTLEASGIAALTGLGGVGKTQTAAHYAHHHRNDYPFVLWVRAESTNTLFADLAQLAQRLVLPGREAKEQSVIVEAMQRWLDGQPRWLLVLDNVEDYAVVRDLARKKSTNGHHVILTTQQQALGQIGKQRLTPMEHEQGALLLLRRAGRMTGAESPGEEDGDSAGPKPVASTVDPQEVALAREISEEVGGLPLALDQAGAYIEETGSGLDDYLSLLKQRFKELAERRGGLDSDHLSVAATYLTSLNSLASQNPAAVELLNATAFLVPDAIPEEIFTDGAGEFGAVLQEAASDPLKWNDAIGAAFKFSLVERNPQKKLLAVHRMVQGVARSRMTAEERKTWAEQVVRGVNTAFPDVEFPRWNQCERMVPSAQACAAVVKEYGVSPTGASRLFNNVGYYLAERARYAEAEPLYRLAMTLDETAFGPDHAEVATDLNNLGELLRVTNRLAEAEPMYEQAVKIWETSLGPEHAQVAIGLNNQALLMQTTNRLAEAEPLYRRALKIDEAFYGLDHPDVARDINNLAELFRVTNRLAEAEPLYRRALTIWKTAFGPDHPQVAAGLNNLALLLQTTNRMAEAEPLMRQALDIDQKCFGPEHPSVARDLNNLASLMYGTNRLGEAEPLMRQALVIDEKTYGPNHPDVARDLNNLAWLLQDSNRLAEAEPLYWRAVKIWESALGPDHPQVAVGLNNLSLLMQATDRAAEAEKLIRRSLAIDEKSYGPEHPNVARNLNNLAHLMHNTNRMAEAEPLMRRALEIDQKAYGPEHPDVARDLNNLARLLQDTNRMAEAEPLMRRHLEILWKFTRVTGHQHQHLQMAVENYVALLQNMGYSQEQIAARLQEVETTGA